MFRRIPAGRTGRRPLAALAAAALVSLAACGRDAPTGPRTDAAPLQLAFVDNFFRLTLLESGGAPLLTGVTAIPFAAIHDRIAYWQLDTLYVYDVAAGVAHRTPVVGKPDNAADVGALSPDGTRIAFASGARNAPIWLHVVHLGSGQRDSADIARHVSPEIALRIVDAAPTFSPGGDRVGFLLPNPLAMHFLFVEPLNWRVELHLLWVATSTTVEPITGWPRWLANGRVHFIARKRTLEGQPVDTLMILSVNPMHGELGAAVEHLAAMPADLSLDGARGYSFSADGRAAALMVRASGRDGVFLIREGASSLEPLVFGAAEAPRFPILVP